MKISIKSVSLCFLFGFLCGFLPAFVARAAGLVEYSEGSTSFPAAGPSHLVPLPSAAAGSTVNMPVSTADESKSSLNILQQLHVETAYELLEVQTTQQTDSWQRALVASEIHFVNDIYVATNYWQGQSRGHTLLAQNTSFQAGNFSFLVGYPWLKIPEEGAQTQFDFYVGQSFGQRSGDFATSRDSQMLGVKTEKRFTQWDVALGFEQKFVSAPRNREEVAIGDITSVAATLGYRFNDWLYTSARGIHDKIRRRNSSTTTLSQDFNATTLDMRMFIFLSGAIQFYIGGRLATQRQDFSQQLLQAKLYEYYSSNSRTLSTGFIISI